MAVPKKKDGKPVKPETAQPEKSGRVYSDKANNGAQYVVVKQEGGPGSPVGILYTLVATTPGQQPPAFTVTEWALEQYYRHRPDLDAKQRRGGLNTENTPV